ncbi:hypothetical protein G6F60_015265 [Rhizopus arrhizus]|nr:hypothetical protein G6F60_015265 [Rhizopus arrhizus]
MANAPCCACWTRRQGACSWNAWASARHRAGDGADRQRQDRRLRPGPAAVHRPQPDPRAGAGAVPDPRTGRPGRQADPQAGHRHSQPEAAAAGGWRAAGPAAGVAGRP